MHELAPGAGSGTSAASSRNRLFGIEYPLDLIEMQRSVDRIELGELARGFRGDRRRARAPAGWPVESADHLHLRRALEVIEVVERVGDRGAGRR